MNIPTELSIDTSENVKTSRKTSRRLISKASAAHQGPEGETTPVSRRKDLQFENSAQEKILESAKEI